MTTTETRTSTRTSTPAPAPPSEAYRSEAGRYDRRTDAFRRWRELLVDALPAMPGDTVLDAGCGTGLCLPLLQRKVGAHGTIVAIYESEQMLQVASDRVARHGWTNVRLLAAPVAAAPIGCTADAALFCAVHDMLQSRPALNNIFDHLRPGAPVAAAGGKWPAVPLWPAASLGHQAAHTVRPRLQRLRPAMAPADGVRRRCARPSTGRRHRISRTRPRPTPLTPQRRRNPADAAADPTCRHRR